MPGKKPACLLSIVTLCLVFFQLELGCCVQPIAARVQSKGKSTVDPSKENLSIGLSKYKAKDVDGAIDSFLQSIYFARNYYDPDAYYWLGICYMDKKQDAKAIEAFNKHCQQSVALTPEAHVFLGEIYLRNNRLAEAEGESKLAMSQYRGPGPKAHNLLGKVKDKQNDLADAQYEFREALGDQPWHYTEAWMNYAENMMKQKAWGPAIDQFHFMLHNRVILKELEYRRVFLDIGICLLAKGDHQGAFDNWHEALNYDPQYADAHLQLGMLLDAEQHFSAAIKEYEQYVRDVGDNTGAEKIKQRIHQLEQKLAPNEIEPQAPKPSMYMRNQEESQKREETKQKEDMTPAPPLKDSGF
jgi:tetratricopeptide (TPR) repeat protein